VCLNGDKCDPKCIKDNEAWNEQTQSCDETNCPKGQKIKEGRCVDHICPDGFTMNKKTWMCEKIYCEEGYDLLGDKCVRTSCPGDYVLSGDICIKGCKDREKCLKKYNKKIAKVNKELEKVEDKLNKFDNRRLKNKELDEENGDENEADWADKKESNDHEHSSDEADNKPEDSENKADKKDHDFHHHHHHHDKEIKVKDTEKKYEIEKDIKKLNKKLDHYQGHIRKCEKIRCKYECNKEDEKFKKKEKRCDKTKCPEPYKLKDGVCVVDCKKDQELVEGECVCIKEYKIIDKDGKCKKRCKKDEKWVFYDETPVNEENPDANFNQEDDNGNPQSIIRRLQFIHGKKGEGHCEKVCLEKEEDWNTKKQKCEKTSCPKGKKIKDGKCVNLKCPSSYTMNKNTFMCERIYCLTGYILNNEKKCERRFCPPGYKLNGIMCDFSCNKDELYNSKTEKCDKTKCP